MEIQCLCDEQLLLGQPKQTLAPRSQGRGDHHMGITQGAVLNGEWSWYQS